MKQVKKIESDLNKYQSKITKLEKSKTKLKADIKNHKLRYAKSQSNNSKLKSKIKSGNFRVREYKKYIDISLEDSDRL